MNSSRLTHKPSTLSKRKIHKNGSGLVHQGQKNSPKKDSIFVLVTLPTHSYWASREILNKQEHPPAGVPNILYAPPPQM